MPNLLAFLFSILLLIAQAGAALAGGAPVDSVVGEESPLGQRLAALQADGPFGSELPLKEMQPGDWDRVCHFNGYTNYDIIENQIGMPYFNRPNWFQKLLGNSANPTVQRDQDGRKHLIFVNDTEVVASYFFTSYSINLAPSYPPCYSRDAHIIAREEGPGWLQIESEKATRQ